MDATFTLVQEPTPVHSGSRHLVSAEHAYAAEGSFDATVTFSDGRVVTGKVGVEAGYAAPVEWSPDVCVAPGVDVLNAEATIQDNSRLVADLSGLTPNSLVTIQLSQEPITAPAPGATKFEDALIQGRFMTDADGTAHLVLPVVYRTLAGKHLRRVTDVDGRFSEQVITENSSWASLTGEIITGATAGGQDAVCGQGCHGH
ncbi:hypothetical protein H5392_05555 [Tessaracoccus sp. MC1865]|uniref:hypothetical protein n=1 Tax=Tessaracoccus sp. MC1865 TaxID=2760310 RepID=UPI001600E36D|nr:hypothetical protein [Tessaracoccus sp. MC1865]MBB1483326.1 hypothetical protein [Tessaracoccus sp. MC1865]QTO36443.1 hypothetical protein J7D54_07930 [Tessaracoccus sp. MC1865]